ncbi:hypothetical protein MRX96_038981 [Rhipicephalus microplus]
MITTLALVVVCAFTILSLLLLSTRPQKDVSRWCDTSDCRQYATLLARELDRSVDRCHDFDAIAWLDGLPELLEEGAKVASLAAKPLAMYSSCVENSGASEADKGLFLEFLRARKLAWPDKPRGGVGAPTVFVDLAMNWEMTLWMRVRVLKHPFTPGARRFLLLPGRRSDVRLFTALHEYVMSTGDYARSNPVDVIVFLAYHAEADYQYAQCHMVPPTIASSQLLPSLVNTEYPIRLDRVVAAMVSSEAEWPDGVSFALAFGMGGRWYMPLSPPISISLGDECSHTRHPGGYQISSVLTVGK